MAKEQEKNIKFVQEVEKYPCLYDFKLTEYMRKDVTERAWEEIGQKFQITGAESKEKWKNLRSVFVRHLKPAKSGSATAKKKPYYLADYMQFALPFIKIPAKISGNLIETCHETFCNDELHLSQRILPPEEQTNPNETQSLEETLLSQSIIQTQPSTSSILPTLCSQSILQTRPSTSTIPESESRPQPAFIPTEPVPNIQPVPKKKAMQRKKCGENIAEQDISAYFKMKQAKIMENCNNSEENSNKMFLLSLLSDMNKMHDKQKRFFKRRVLELVDEVLDQDSNQLYSPIQILSTPSTINSDTPVDVPVITNDEPNPPNPVALYYQSVPLLLSSRDQNAQDSQDLELI